MASLVPAISLTKGKERERRGPFQSLSPKQGAKLWHASYHPPQHPTTAQDGKQRSHDLFFLRWNTKTVLYQAIAGWPCAFYKTDYRGQMKEAEGVRLHSKLPRCCGQGGRGGRLRLCITFVKSSPPLDKNLEKGHACC